MPESLVCQIINSSHTEVGIDAEHDGNIDHRTLGYGESAAYVLDPDSDIKASYLASPTPALKIRLKGTSTSQVATIVQGICLCMLDGTTISLVPTSSLRLTVGPGVNTPISPSSGPTVAGADDDIGLDIEGVKCGEG